jgi:voltage-gated potassium channel
MSTQTAVFKEHSNSYDIFILVLTVMSLAVMVLLILPLSPETLQLLRVYDNAVCFIFLVDFFGNLAGARPKNAYLVGRRGWLDLLGSVPSFGFLPAAGLLRLFRISRLARISRLLRGQARERLIKDVIDNRGQYAAFITILSAFMVLTVASVMVLQFESRSPDSNITTGGDALWWGLVTITTVGYGDYYPVTALGRLTGVFVMFAGVGIIGSLASILASVLVPPPKEQEASVEPATTVPADDVVASELAKLRVELAALRESLADRPSPSSD